MSSDARAKEERFLVNTDYIQFVFEIFMLMTFGIKKYFIDRLLYLLGISINQ